MSPAARATKDSTLPRPFTSETQLELLVTIYQHRLISTGQLHRLHGVGRTLRSTQRHLSALRSAGLAATHQHRPWESTIWYATTGGAEMAELARIRPRPYRVRPEVAAGQIAAHTLAVNEVGCLLVEAARLRGDEFGPLDWDHEIAHPLRSATAPRPRTDHLVIADAVLSYTANRPDDTQVSMVRFLELDRGTTSVEALVRKVRRYGQMYDHPVNHTPLWRTQYATFPRLLIVLAGQPASRLARRRRTLIDLAREEPDILTHAEPLGTLITTLHELAHPGPFAPIFHPLIAHPEHGDGPLTILRRPGNESVVSGHRP